MKHLRNWENNTWLSSKKYIYKFSKFLTLNFNINKKSKILDIGCGSGMSTNFWGSKSSLVELSKKNFDVSGVEPSSNARNILSSYGIKVFSKIEDINEEKKFEVIRLNWSLEHVHSPSKYFQFIEKFIKLIDDY